MKKNAKKSSNFSFAGALVLFVTIAALMLVAIFFYDYIGKKTDNVALVSVCIFSLIFVLSVVFVFIDSVRRKYTIDAPAEKILRATQKIAEGDFSVRLDITREYGKYTRYDSIAENLNKMASELQKTEVLSMDFVSNVSHEIKTPLSVIQNYATLLAREDTDEETRKSYARTLETAAKRLTDLITNILKLNKLENQEIREKKEAFDLTDSLGNCVVELESLFEAKGVELNCDFDDVTAYSSKSLLEIVWTNLLSNAVKFTPKGGSVEVTLRKIGNDARVEVADTGYGMSAEVGERIFEKFYQGDASRSSEGNGLGLALVKKVIDVLGGEISVHSESGKGSTFSILLKGVCS